MDVIYEIIGIVLYIGMFLFLIAGLCFLIDLWLDGKRESLYAVLINGFLAFVCIWFLAEASSQIQKTPWVRPDPYVTHTIVALQDGNEVNGKIRGSRYSMSGYINEEFMYVYGYKTIGNGMKIQKVSAKNATIFFDDNVIPNAKWYKETRKYWWLDEERYTCDIFIPTDSLQAELVIDLQ